MLSIVLFGTGNVALHLFDAIIKSDKYRIVQVVGRDKKALNYFRERANVSSDFNNLIEADIYIFALNDDSLTTVIEGLNIKDKLLVHTSGSVGLPKLSNKNRAGVFYPLQSINKTRKIDFKKVPLCIEAENENDLETLRVLAEEISSKVVAISSDQRRSLHMAAVFVNNFVNHMYTIGHDICSKQDLPFSLLHPLILETAHKIEELAPKEAQTGPARRNDIGTIDKHKKLLANKRYKEIYSLLSQAIAESYEKEL